VQWQWHLQVRQTGRRVVKCTHPLW
jgi:hypothetical protein